ncbi:MAG: FAD-binding protein [Rubellimicrobium sp.]|nr:FAD-binding protein [Rubellimicrobium sp.]
MAPVDEGELAVLVAGADGPLRVRGGGSHGIGGPGEPISTARLSGITLYEPGALTMVARAGTPLAEIEAALAAEGQYLPWEPPDLRALTGATGAPTIGGVFATNTSGPRRVVAGAARDFLLGVRFIDGRGAVVRNGGRVMKNVTGVDLTRLMAGAYGTLGILTEVSFKVLPRPEAARTLALRGLDAAQAVAVMARALGSPHGVTGAAFLPERAEMLLRLEGPEAALPARVGKLAALIGPLTEAACDWAAIRDGRALAGAGDVWRLSLTPIASPAVVARLPDGARWFMDWGGGRLWVAAAPGSDLRAALGPIPGHATRITGTGGTRFHPEPPGVAALTHALREKFDPRGLFNPGMFD